MFWHNFKYRIKASICAKEEVFWILGFPILLCTCFFIALSGIHDKTAVFHSIPVAVVYEQENEIFKEVLNEVSESDNQGESFLIIDETDTKNAYQLLEDGDVDIIINVKETPELIVNETGINQTAVQTFLNNYLQQQQLYLSLYSGNFDAATIQELTDSLSESVSFINESSFVDTNIDSMTIYYYSLIGMAILFGGFLGMQMAFQMKANITPEGLRKCIVPVNRAAIIFSELLATVLIHIVSLFILLAYMIVILKIDFCNQLGYVALVCAVGSLFGISFGIFLGSIPKLKEGVRYAILISFSLFSSFLAGLMTSSIKIAIEQNVPIINKINPATLIQDALYSLLIYESHTRYYQNLLILSIMTAGLFALSYLMTRREKYASL